MPAPFSYLPIRVCPPTLPGINITRTPSYVSPAAYNIKMNVEITPVIAHVVFLYASAYLPFERLMEPEFRFPKNHLHKSYFHNSSVLN
jgi:hypothetical protein